MSIVSEVTVSQIPTAVEAAWVIDVREDDEWAAGHIDGARHIRMSEIPSRLAELPDQGQLLVVCRVGARSARVAEFLNAHGLNAVNVAGGMQAWAVAGRPMLSSTGSPPEVI